MSTLLVSAHCPACRASSPVVATLPELGSVRAWELECGHAYLMDSQHGTGSVSVDQWQAALYWITPGTHHGFLRDMNGNRTPSFPRLCAQFTATRTRRYGADRYVTL